MPGALQGVGNDLLAGALDRCGRGRLLGEGKRSEDESPEHGVILRERTLRLYFL